MTILVGVDFRPSSRAALLEGCRLARALDRPLLVMHVIDGRINAEIEEVSGLSPAEISHRLEEHRQSWLSAWIEETLSTLEPNAVSMTAELCWGFPFEELIRRARQDRFEMLIIGTGSPHDDVQSSLFGGTATKVLRFAPCPVLCVPPRSAEET